MSKSKVVKMLELRVANLEALMAAQAIASGQEQIPKYLENIRKLFGPKDAGVALAHAVNAAEKTQAKKAIAKSKALQKKLQKQETKAMKLDKKLIKKIVKHNAVKPTPKAKLTKVQPAPDLHSPPV